MSAEPAQRGADPDRGPDRPRSLDRFRRFGRLVAGESRQVRSLADGRRFAGWLVLLVAGAARWRIARVARGLRRAVRGKYRAVRGRYRAARRRLRSIVRRLQRAARRRRRAAKRFVHRRLRKVSRPRRPQHRRDDDAPTAGYRLGPAMAASGPRAEAVLAASSRVDGAVRPHTEVLIVDTRDRADGAGSTPPRTVVALSETDPRASVPALDAESLNPVGWTIDHSGGAVSLGPPERAPASKRPPRAASPDDHGACRRAHHVVDASAYHDDTLARAGTLVKLAATGAVVHIIDGDDDLRRRLGSELYELMADHRIVSADPHEREAFSVAMRRAVLRDHSLRARVRQILDPTELQAPPLPEVSILLATRRPDQTAAAIASVACQSYPRAELVLALHGGGFDRTALDRLLEDLDLPVRVVEAAGDLPLGAVLNEAAGAASGSLLTKFDDDDMYGTEHLWDLVLAHEYSRAPLVGKGAEFVYLADSDVTLHRWRGGGERYVTTQSIAGGALMITRHCFDAVLGWQPIPRGVDRALIADVVGGGHRVYRTHGMGYVLVRHGGGHTWQADDDYFLAQALETRSGCDLAFAGIAPPGSPCR